MGVKQQRLRAGVGPQTNLPKRGRLWIPELISQRTVFKTKLPTLLGEELTRVAAGGQHSCPLVKTTTALTKLHELEELPHLKIAMSPVDILNQILLTSQSPGETTSESLLVHQYQD
jgi:hypothetical protein